MPRKWLLTAGTFVLTGGLLLLLYYYTSETVLKARVSPLGLAVGETLHYADSTTNATTWYWEFGGAGDTSSRSTGSFRYTRPGNYLVRLTVNGQYRRFFRVQVKPPLSRQDAIIRLLGPTIGYQNEKLSFQTFGGQARRFAWNFGENGRKQVDSREPIAIYSYAAPGIYRVRLTTDVTQEPLQLSVRILPSYSRLIPSVDTAANDIRWHLQRIAEGRQVNEHYSYLLRRYLCSKLDAQVVAGTAPANDFYSYCMNLQFDPGWTIDTVVLEPAPASGCTAKLVVAQHKEE